MPETKLIACAALVGLPRNPLHWLQPPAADFRGVLLAQIPEQAKREILGLNKQRALGLATAR